MDFNDSFAEAQFRAQVRQWLELNAADYRQPLDTSDITGYTAKARDWQRRKAEAGYAAICWPKSEGGLDGTSMMEVIFAEEEARYHVPIGPLVTIGTSMAVPTIRKHGSPEQVEQFTRATLYGEALWCQLFSEPSAGSDLANVRTRAVRDGDNWVINGQKVWTSWAHVSDWGILLARTDPSLPKHKGMTFFLVDMRSQGIEVRPIKQISGESEFNEVFFTDLRIPDSCRIGAVGEGWKVAITTLMNERMHTVVDQSLPSVQDMIRQAKDAGTGFDRHRAAQLLTQELGLRFFRFRMLTTLSRGDTPGAISAMSKLVLANTLQDLSAMALDQAGLHGICTEGDELMTKFQYGYDWGAALRIAGGADEILRNQIAERVLGMPGEIRVDKDIPFSECR